MTIQNGCSQCLGSKARPFLYYQIYCFMIKTWQANWTYLSSVLGWPKRHLDRGQLVYIYNTLKVCPSPDIPKFEDRSGLILSQIHFQQVKIYLMERYKTRKHGGTLVWHLLQNLMVPFSNLEKWIWNDAGSLKFKIYTILFVYICGLRSQFLG